MLPSFKDYLYQQTKKSSSNTGYTKPYSNQYLGIGPSPLTTQAQPLKALEKLQPMQPADGNGGYLDSATQNNSYNGGSVSGSGGAAQAVPDDTAQKNSIYDTVKNKLGSLKTVFDGLFSSIDNVVKERTGDLQKQQQNTLDDLSKQYLTADNQTRSIYGARGLSDSSYIGDALGQNNDIFNRSFDDVGNQFNQKAGALGQFASAQKGALQSQLQNTQQYVDSLGQNMDGLGLADLVGADQQLGQAIGSAQANASNYMTNPQMLAELNKITPINNAGTSQLAGRLQALVTSSAPIFAKRQIAQGLVKASGLQDENAKGYWQSAFEDMLKKSGQA